MIKRDINILIVEDQKILRKTLDVILKEEGYNITCADNGEKAVELAEKKFFNIAIIDIRLPDISGLDVLRTIREINHYICGIIITAYASIDTVINAVKEEDAYDYLIKPFDFDRLKKIIEKGLEKQRLEIENR